MENLKQEEALPPQSPSVPQPTPPFTPQSSSKKNYLLIGIIVAIVIGIGTFVLLTQKEVPPLIPEPVDTSSLPVISLRYQRGIFEGVQGSYCWPTGGVDEATLCADTTFPESDETIIVLHGNEFKVLIEAATAPNNLGVSIFNEEQSFITSLELTAGLTSSFNINQAPGVYYLLVSGAWPVGDISYGFKIKVRDSLDISSASDWQTYRNEEFGFEVKYPEFYQRYKLDIQREVAASFLYDNPKEDRTLGLDIKVIEHNLDGYEIAGSGGESASFDADKKEWREPERLGGELAQWITKANLSNEIYLYGFADGACNRQIGVIPSPSHSFFIRIVDRTCYYGGSEVSTFDLDLNQILSPDGTTFELLGRLMELNILN